MANQERNMERLTEIRRTNPSATHVYFKRVGRDGTVIDIPMASAEFTIKQWPEWEIVASNKSMDDIVERLFDD